MYDPQGSAQQHRVSLPSGTNPAKDADPKPHHTDVPMSTYSPNQPVTWVDYNRADQSADEKKKGVESFYERAAARGTIFMYQKKVAQEGVFYRGCQMVC